MRGADYKAVIIVVTFNKSKRCAYKCLGRRQRNDDNEDDDIFWPMFIPF